MASIAASFRELGVEILTTEGRIVMHLNAFGPTKVKELMIATAASYRGFYLALDRLKEQALVVTASDPNDKRVRIISLAEMPA